MGSWPQPIHSSSPRTRWIRRTRCRWWNSTPTALRWGRRPVCPPHPLALSAPGDYILTARVTDAGGRTAASPPVRVSLGSPAATLVSAGSAWTYNDTGVNLSNAWRAPLFDDSAWPSGPSQLGYGDYDEATVVSYGTNFSYKNITTYFRRAFTVDAPTRFATLLLRVLRDDGAVVYLNDVQVWRNNISSEPLSYTTLADSAVTGGDESTNFHTVMWTPHF